MSRIGKKPIEITGNVSLEVTGQNIKVTGPRGELSFVFSPLIKIEVGESTVQVTATEETKEASSLHGLTRTLVANMIKGVAEGFEKRLEYHGVGYRAAMEGKVLVMQLGFSHPVRYTPAEGIEIKVEKNAIIVSGIDKQLVGQVAAEIRAFKKPEPYKGKGIRYQGEKIRRKAGKAAAKG